MPEAKKRTLILGFWRRRPCSLRAHQRFFRQWRRALLNDTGEGKLKIPRKIKIGNAWYEINKVKIMDTPDAMGSTNYRARCIKLASHSNTRYTKYRQEDTNETFWHEITHAILFEMGHKLATNEKFVEAFSKRLSRAIDSAKF
jgi:hypothetical protein